jgi:hypothetical protein
MAVFQLPCDGSSLHLRQSQQRGAIQPELWHVRSDNDTSCFRTLRHDTTGAYERLPADRDFMPEMVAAPNEDIPADLHNSEEDVSSQADKRPQDILDGTVDSLLILQCPLDDLVVLHSDLGCFVLQAKSSISISSYPLVHLRIRVQLLDSRHNILRSSENTVISVVKTIVIGCCDQWRLHGPGVSYEAPSAVHSGRVGKIGACDKSQTVIA